MDGTIVQSAVDLINNVGFPIAACIYFAWQNEKLRKTVDANTEAMRDLKEVIVEKVGGF